MGAEEHVMHFLVMDLNKTACNNQSDTLKDLLDTKSPNMFPFLRGHMTDFVHFGKSKLKCSPIFFPYLVKGLGVRCCSVYQKKNSTFVLQQNVWP